MSDNEKDWIIRECNLIITQLVDETGSVRKQILRYFTAYYKKGEYHRLDGPAKIYHDDAPFMPGLKFWYIDGERVPVDSQKQFERYLKMKAFW
jgi:hypothetical protein